MKEPIYTPGGLKIRLDEEGVERVLADADGKLDLSDAFADTELWADFPGAVSNVAAILLAIATRSWIWTLVGAVVGYSIAHLGQQIFYSHWLKVVFPQFLGGWLIALLASLGAASYLWWATSSLAGVAAVAVVLLNWIGIADLLLVLLMPAAVFTRRLVGQALGDTELAFIAVINRQARQRGIKLNWDRYADGT